MARAVLTLALLMVSLVLAAPVAGQDRHQQTYSGITANAGWSTCTPDTPEPGLQTCEDVSVFVLEGSSVNKSGAGAPQRDSTMVCVGVFSYVQGPEFWESISEEHGCTNDFDFSVASDLSGAELTATVPIETFVCNEVECGPTGDSRDVDIDVTWTALEAPHAVNERGVNHWDSCMDRHSRRGVMAWSTATGTLDGAPLGEADFGEIFSGRSSFAFRCR